jgi:glutaredoxin
MAYAFIGFVSVFLTVYLVNPGINLIPSSQYVLVYSQGCPHCEEVIQFCKTHSISVKTQDAKEVAGILKTLKIEHVPVLFCDEGATKKFIIGQNNVKDYLLSKMTQTTKEQDLETKKKIKANRNEPVKMTLKVKEKKVEKVEPEHNKPAETATTTDSFTEGGFLSYWKAAL